MRKIPTPPPKETFSPRTRYDVKIKNMGVKARNGTLRLIGEIFKAFVYKMIALISKGRAQKVANQKVLSNEGISINIKHMKRTGSENNNLAHATRYSSLDAKACLVKASLVANKKAVKRE